MSLFKMDDGTWYFKCHGCGERGDPIKYLQKSKDMTFTESVQYLIGEAQTAPMPKKPLETYDYYSAQGELLYQVCRFENKDFRCRRPNGDGWIWDMCGVSRVLYRLPKLLELPPNSTVYYVEGEKDVHTLERFGLCATTHAGGAGAFRAELLSGLPSLVTGLVVIPDMDEPGKGLMRKVYATGRERKLEPGFILLSDWSGYDPNVSGFDVSDFFERGGTVQELRGMIK